MEQLKMMKENLTAAVMGQMSNLQQADCKELSEAVDMIKDLSEAIYYCEITKAMEEQLKDKQEYMPSRETVYYTEYPYYRRYDGGGNNGGSSSTSSQSGSNNNNSQGTNQYSSQYSERQYPRIDVRDRREGRSPITRRMYMESKEHSDVDVNQHLRELETYMQELSSDITEMVRGASAEERQLLSRKLSTLANKLQEI